MGRMPHHMTLLNIGITLSGVVRELWKQILSQGDSSLPLMRSNIHLVETAILEDCHITVHQLAQDDKIRIELCITICIAKGACSIGSQATHTLTQAETILLFQGSFSPVTRKSGLCFTMIQNLRPNQNNGSTLTYHLLGQTCSDDRFLGKRYYNYMSFLNFTVIKIVGGYQNPEAQNDQTSLPLIHNFKIA